MIFILLRVQDSKASVRCGRGCALVVPACQLDCRTTHRTASGIANHTSPRRMAFLLLRPDGMKRNERCRQKCNQPDTVCEPHLGKMPCLFFFFETACADSLYVHTSGTRWQRW